MFYQRNSGQSTEVQKPAVSWSSKWVLGTIFIISVVVLLYFRCVGTLWKREELEGRQAVTQEKPLSMNDMSITREDAITLAEQKIHEQSKQVLVIKEVKTTDTGWIFYYDSKEAVETGNQERDGVPGNVPLYIDKDGSMKYLPNPNDPLLKLY